MRWIYYARVYLISFEFLSVVIGVATCLFFRDLLERYFSEISLNKDAIEWMTLLPLGVSCWVLKEGHAILFPEHENLKLLHEWPDYWRFEAHVYIGVFNALLFSSVCVGIWFFGFIDTIIGLWLFLVFVLANGINALSFYFAKIAVKKSLIKVRV